MIAAAVLLDHAIEAGILSELDAEALALRIDELEVTQ